MVGAENGVPDLRAPGGRRARSATPSGRRRWSKGREEAVGGVVVVRYGVSTMDVIERVKEKITALQAGLPAGGARSSPSTTAPP